MPAKRLTLTFWTGEPQCFLITAETAHEVELQWPQAPAITFSDWYGTPYRFETHTLTGLSIVT